MDNLKNDSYYVNKIIEDLEFIILYTKGKTQKEIEGNPLLVDSIMFRLIQITENTNKLTEDFKLKNNNIPWHAIKGMRNRIVHAYGEVNFTIVCNVVLNSIPQLYNDLKEIKI